jgi:beta-lactamase class A
MRDVVLGSARRERARRKALMALGALLVVGAGAGGVFAASHLTAEKVAYTKGPVPMKARLVSTAVAAGPAAPAAFQAAIEKLAAGYGEPVGIAVTDVADGWTASVDGNQRFPQQSVSKLWVALTVMQAVDDKRLALDQVLTMGPQDRSVFYQPLAARIHAAGLPITVRELLRWALTESDNSANDKLVQQVGGADVIARTIAAKGLAGLAVGGTERDLQTRTAGLTWKPEYGVTWIFKQARAQLPDSVRDAAQAAYLANPPDGATPLGIVTALTALKRGQLLSADSTDVMLGFMGDARTGVLRLKAGLPRGFTLAHKTGTGPDWRGASVGINDVGLITAPDGHTYAVAVMIRQTRRSNEARHALMQGVTRAVAAQWSRHDTLPAAGLQVASGPATTASGE